MRRGSGSTCLRRSASRSSPAPDLPFPLGPRAWTRLRATVELVPNFRLETTMTRFTKRRLLTTVGAAALAMLVGCGKKDDTPAAPATPAPATAAKAGPLKIAFAYVGPVG